LHSFRKYFDFLFEELKDEPSFYPLIRAFTEMLKGKFEGSIGWYTTTVHLDLEARQVVDCSRGKSPQMIRLAKAE
jgi:hypothetical protein